MQHRLQPGAGRAFWGEHKDATSIMPSNPGVGTIGDSCPVPDSSSSVMPPLHRDTSELGVVPCGKEI